MDLAWPWVVAVAAGWPLLELIAWLRRAPVLAAGDTAAAIFGLGE